MNTTPISFNAYVAAVEQIAANPLHPDVAERRYKNFLDSLKSGWTTTLSDAECHLFGMIKLNEALPRCVTRRAGRVVLAPN